MNTAFRGACVAACLLPLAARAADQPPLPPAMIAVLNGPEHRTALLQAAHAVDGPGLPACADANYTTTGEVLILQAPRIENGKVVAGAWKEQVRQAGCGGERMLNTLSFAGPNGAIQTRALLPGSTVTDPQLQQDSVQYAASGLGAMPAGCEQGGVVDTRYVGLDGQPAGTRQAENATPRPWTEIWTLQACAKRAEVEMHFTPDATGTEIRANPVK